MQIFLIIFKQEILTSLHHFGKILANFLFFIISVAVFLLLAQNQQNQDFSKIYSITIIWFSLLFCLIFSAAEFLKKDFDDGTIEQIFLHCENFEVFILAKMLGNWLTSSLPILIFTLPLGILIELDQSLINKLLILVFLASLLINFICTFCGSLSALGNSAPMISIIALPLIIPILLVAYSGMFEEFEVSVKILLGLCVFLGPILTFTTSKIIKIAAE
jgi:heme exporter protein B